MRTVKEISDLTGISVRTLHYYDEIGLLKPTEKSDAGYRLYDDKALETLQQILFFREFDISLKEIKAVLDNPALERNQILQVQRKMFVMKQLAQIKEEKGFMMAQTQYYRNEQIKPMIDEKYGEGASDFFAQAIENYYKVK